MAASKRPRLTHNNGFVDLTLEDEDPIPKKKSANGVITTGNKPKTTASLVNQVIKPLADVKIEPSLIHGLVSQDALVDKYRPKSSKEIIGQAGDRSNVAKLNKWLSSWYENREAEKSNKKKATKPRFATDDDGSSYRAALLSGPPGIGKTTTAQLVLKEAGFVFKELNASDTRNQKSLKDEIIGLQNTVVDEYFKSNPVESSSKSSKSSSRSKISSAPSNSVMKTKHALIMDEVDGMAGNEDRGGVAEVIKLIKETKIPIICICNDRSHPKMRSLINHCYDLRFYKPRADQIRESLSKIASSEGMNVSTTVLDEIVVSSNQDIRQSINYLNMLSAKKNNVNKTINSKAMKDVQLGPFDAIKKVFPTGFDASKKSSLNDKCDLFFFDYNLMPLMVYENYLRTQQPVSRNPIEKLKAVARAADSMAVGDMIEKNIRSSMNWGLLPLQAVFSVALPSYFMKSSLNSMPMFPSYLGRISNLNKRDRLLQELKVHMNLKISGTKTALSLDYLEPLRNGIMKPLREGDVESTVNFLNDYYLRKEDLDSIFELTSFSGETDPYSKIDSKVKAALTRAINKSSVLLPYSLGDADFVKKTKTTKGKGKGKSSSKGDSEEEAASNGDEEDQEEMDVEIPTFE